MFKYSLLSLIISLIAGICFSAFSTFSLAAELQPPPSKSSLFDSDLRYWLSSEKLLTIKDEEQEIAVLFSEYMAAPKRGIIVLLPGLEQSPLYNNGLSYLHQTLTDDGYDTYTLPVPDLTEGNDITQGMMDGEPNEVKSTAIPVLSEFALDNYKAALVARFEALYKTLALRQQEHIAIVAFGNSAGLFAEYLATLPSIRVDALITVSAQLANAQRNSHLPASLSLVAPALLDVFYTFDSPLVLDTIDERKRWARRNSKLDYRQRELFGEQHQPMQHQRLRKELTGFLRRL
ncbi:MULTISPECIES: DUF3530 family protein [unclassified Pseudoalteromonas]|uniref:DUF3530 family protein n=1 Tax=unclassified Pseudoalteromonas TaxID=194690 RepID=UPI0020982767|nr:DUF3530 family protein [Pseudoalteromonas sp. XMcav2-N]MCO7186893.1 alpha/beta hydrolase family protein [Pseudoalteromonas sp. XMcav2-N]